jgi:hypothetical protein
MHEIYHCARIVVAWIGTADAFGDFIFEAMRMIQTLFQDHSVPRAAGVAIFNKSDESPL